jgi:steroid delta-isomerase-like uncharacterized protein
VKPVSISVEENKAICRRFFEEVFNKHNLDALDEFLATNYVDHTQSDAQGLKNELRDMFAAAPDIHAVIEDVIAEGDKVVLRLTKRGTMIGEYAGVRPSGNTFDVSEIHIFRIADGKIIEHWDLFDMLSVMEALDLKGFW